MTARLSRVPVLPLVAGGYVMGVVAGAILGGPWVLTLLLGVLLGAIAAVRGGSFALLAVLGLTVLAAAFGHWRIADLDAQPPPPLASMTGPHEVLGVARADAVVEGSMRRVDLDVESVDGAPFEGGIRVSARASEDEVRAGDRVRLIADLEAPPELEAFDYRAYLRDRDIYLVASFPKEWEHLGATDRGWRGVLEDLHRSVVTRIGRALPEPEAALAAGILVGEHGALPDDVDEALRATGTTHLVVVSGQNVALLIALAIAALTAVMSRRAASIAAIALLPAYVVFVGAEPPVIRAGIMAVAVIAAGATGRRTPGWAFLTYAAGVMLVDDPALVRDVSFQLSATATAGITTLAPALRDATLGRWPALSSPGRAALVSVAATATGAALAVLPVQVAAFGVLAPWTVLANVLVAPLYTAMVMAAAIAAAFGGSLPLGEVLALVPAAFIALVEVLARLPGAQVEVSLPLVAGVAFTGGLLVLTARLAGYAREHTPEAVLDGGVTTGIATTTGLAVVAAGLWWGALTPTEDLPRVTVLDVGQGLAVLAEDGDATLLIDTGPLDGAILAALGRAGVSAIDAVVLTHHDLDHTGGLGWLTDRMDVGAVYAEASTTDQYEGAASLDIGDRLDVGRITVEVLAPPVATRSRALASDNDGSLVLMVKVGERRILVTGDIEAAGESWLVASGMDLRADVLVVPHHGSNTSSTAAFIQAVSPAVAVIPVGPNTYGHPHPDVLARYEADETVEVYRTDEDGAVTFRSNGDTLWVSTAR
ncbi:MAG: DNA internalization-related competence protein ComEC/Rec2 [Dehalococcoidia bacterium]|nr:DNA internalization-related competence protein ComEC/Rec2 [Dehalococcoidia bacterium]